MVRGAYWGPAGKGNHMKRYVAGLAVGTLGLAASSCAGPSSDLRVASRTVAAVSMPASSLAGSWSGYFMNTAQIGDSRFIHGDYALQFNDDGTYTGTRITRLVAGSSRGGQNKLAGRVIVQGNRVILDDDSGWRMTLVRGGNVLYGVTADPSTQWPILVDLERAEPSDKVGSR